MCRVTRDTCRVCRVTLVEVTKDFFAAHKNAIFLLQASGNLHVGPGGKVVNMSPKKQQRSGHELTAEEKAGRVCSICEVPVPGAYTWLDPATQQPCYGSRGDSSSREASRASSRRTSMAGDV